MNVFRTAKDLQGYLNGLSIENSIGFVPTMGALHQGHKSLVERASKENSTVVISIFVNPTQFDNERDLEKYPRDLEKDLSFIEDIGDQIVVFAPSPSEVYGDKVKAKKYDFEGLEDEMEGKHRKGHFNGVATVLNHLFRIIEPDRAYFGEKDFQQLQIVKKLVVIENIPVEIIGCPILREKNGLAMSSRNKRLTKKQTEEAALIAEVLEQTKRNFDKKSIEELTQDAVAAFKTNPHLELEYFEIANIKNLKTAQTKKEKVTYRAFTAAFAGDVRLIDNMALN